MSDSRQSKREEWRQHWGLVLASAVGFGFFAVPLTSAGLFIDPLGKEFGWSKAEATYGLSIASITVAILSPFFGALIDRFGTRVLALPGIILTAAAVSAFSLANGSLTQWAIMWFVYALFSLAVKSTIWTTAVVGVFSAGRGLALGLTISGSALASIFVPPIGNALIENMGWRSAYVWLAVGWGAVSLLLCLIFHRDAHNVNRAKAKASPAGDHVVPDLPGLSLHEAWRSTALWRIAISTFVIMMLSLAIQVHQFPLLTEAGVSRTNAAWLVSLAGVAAIAGKLVTGWLMDRWNANIVGGVTLALSAVAYILLLETFRTTPLIVVSMVINGYAGGTKMQIAGYLTARYAGLKNYGKIYGLMTSIIAFGAGIGPALGGVIYEIYGNYTLLLLVGIVGCLFSAVLIFGLGRDPDWRGRASGKEPLRELPA